jgi:O-antigen/teichoic acid export membrane protein
MTRMRNLLSQTVVYMIGLGASRGMGLLLVPLYTRQLTGPDFFTWDLSTTTVLFALAVAELGMSSALARFYVKADSDDERRAVAQTSSAIALASVALATIGIFAFQDRLAAAVFGGLNQSGLIGIIAMTVALTALGNLPLALLRAQERAVAFAALCLVRAAVGPACIIVLVVGYDFGVRGILIGDAIGLGAQAIIGLGLCRSQLLPMMHKAAARTLLAFGVPLIPIGIANTIVIASDRYFLREFVDPSEAATFSLGFKIATIVNLVTMALQTAWAPTAFRIAKREDAQRMLAETFRILAVGLGALALATSICAPELTRLFAPAGSYVGAQRIVPWIAFSYVLQSAVLILNTNLVIANRTIFSTVIFSVGAAIKLGLNYIAIPRYGIEGAAASTLLTFLIELVLTYQISRFVYPLPYKTRKVIVLGVLLTAGSYIAGSVEGLEWALSCAVRIVVAAGFVVSLWLTGIVSSAEFASIRTFLSYPAKAWRR